MDHHSASDQVQIHDEKEAEKSQKSIHQDVKHLDDPLTCGQSPLELRPGRNDPCWSGEMHTGLVAATRERRRIFPMRDVLIALAWAHCIGKESQNTSWGHGEMIHPYRELLSSVGLGTSRTLALGDDHRGKGEDAHT